MTSCLDTSPQALRRQLDTLHANTCAWSISLSCRIREAHQQFVLGGMIFGGENFLETAAVSLWRHVAIWKFDEFRQEVADRVRDLNNDPAVQHAMRLTEGAASPMQVNLEMEPDRNAALSNVDWNNQTDDAFFQLMDCGREVFDHLSPLIDAAHECLRLSA